MKKTIITLVVSIVAMAFVSTASAAITDLNPAPFRGEEGTTFQAWTFSTPDNPVAPDESQNANGQATVNLGGDFSTNTVWLDDDMGHQGVWIVDRNEQSDMVIDIPNFINDNPIKEIWVQIVFDSADGLPPNVFILPEGDETPPVKTLDTVEIVDLDGIYSLATLSITIEPNPDFELLVIRPRFCQVYVDEIIVETQCIPEPMTMALLALGGLMIRKRR